MVSDKYLAGLIDADGCLDLSVHKVKDSYYIRPRVRITQKIELGLPLNKRKTKQGYFEWSENGVSLINRVKQHLVLKRGQAEWLSEIDLSGGHTKEEVKKYKKALRAVRYVRSTEKNFPSRKWLAGYFDGDGCLTAGLRKDRTKPYIAAMITVYKDDLASIELIQKNFGGFIQQKTDTTYRWDLWLNGTNVEKFLTYFSKHMLIKRYQSDLVLDWFRNKHKTCSRDMAEDFVNKLRITKLPATTK